MPCIALIGGDGAGKTTLTRMLVEAEPQRLHYLYMGVNVESSNVALPTSRFFINFICSFVLRSSSFFNFSRLPSCSFNSLPQI